MKRALHILALAALCCMTLLSCEKFVFEESEADCDGGTLQVSLRINTGGEGSGVSRALTETEETGSGYENYIDISSLHILFFDTDNKFLQRFSPDEVKPVDNTAYPQKWELRGTVTNPPAGGFKVVVLANWPSSPAGLQARVTTIEDVCKADWSMTRYSGTSDVPFKPSAESTIPMYGVKNVNALYFRPDVETYLGEVSLLRALAKIEVSLNAGCETELESVTLNKHNKDFACAPLGMYDNTSYSGTAHLCREAEDNTPEATLSFSADSERKVWTIYVPEYINAGPTGMARGDCSFIELKLKDSEAVYRIDFRDYSTTKDDGRRFDIIRNYEYRYTVNVTPILFTVNVEKWVFGGKVYIDL